MQKLLEIGFVPTGNWSIAANQIQPELVCHQQATNLIYCFVVNAVPVYFGITRNALSIRMYQYANPGKSQSTNIRINELIKNELQAQSTVEIFTFIDKGLLKFGDFAINLSLGLEETLISRYNTSWNVRGNNRIGEILAQLQEDQLIKEETSPENNSRELEQTCFPINVIATYFKAGFINIPKEYSQYFGEERDSISVIFGNTKYNGIIYRNANNGSPRIYVGSELASWIKQNCKIGEKINIQKMNDEIVLTTQ
jgi:hypothetical protein